MHVKEATNLHPFHKEISSVLETVGNLPRDANTKEGLPPMMDDCIWVNTKHELEKVAEILSRETEFAVDTEQHSIRSFLGFTALLQVSTRKQDFLIDAIALHDEMGLLRKFFANPSIRKVFHGADSDIHWLQKDFHIYVVNLFDTAKACEVLGKRPRSLAYLLEHYCGVVTNKIFQLADWRLRPLPEEMLVYARTDAHYLLYIADCLQNELLQGRNMHQNSSHSTSLYEECVRRSNLMCLQLYEKDTTPPASIAGSLLSRYHGSLNLSQEHNSRFQQTLTALCEWRDTVARSADESPRYVLSDRAMLAIAERNPVDLNAILECLSEWSGSAPALDESPYMTPLPSPSPVLLENIEALKEVLDYVSKGKLQSSSPSNMSQFNKVSENQSSTHIEQRPRKIRKSRDYEAFRKKFVQKFSCKGPVYQNCRIYAGDGGLLCFCDRKKLDWYVQRGLAEFLDEDPPAIKLLFEPKRRPEDENNDFYLQSKTNCCVGCGETNHYLRYRVIPSCYRQYFPEHLKSHRSHDIVLLCVDCHEIAHVAAERHKRQVALKFGVPLFAKRVVDAGTLGEKGFEAQVVDVSVGGVSPRPLRTAAVALLRYGSVMPKERREELEAVVQAYYGGRVISQEDITAAALVGRGLRDSSRRQRRKGVAADKIIRSEDVGDCTANLNCVDMKEEEKNAPHLASTNNLSIERGVSQDLEEITVASDNLVWNETVMEKGTEKEESEDNRSDGADPPLRTDDTACCQDLGGIIPYNEIIATVKDIDEEQDLFNEVGIEGGEATPVEKLASLAKSQKQRVSLLGHGPHGKKVVQMILEREGEDGIDQFCQMWRSVFVEAVKPTHLPGGWNILHSGYREFGEYSIYNRAKAQQVDFNNEDE
ncbi:hypothetical protein GOP47_0005026 [Adiantum capillus-veneris]|uniref:HRDC domain-containing protein n=1 Tax=Adiantum capillus-veneris TaxID=13818 RepID=A0A9D4V540_ADICA|nr:hypothetical protein GOP47_0005026 [Adiantum capillus-veneris]